MTDITRREFVKVGAVGAAALAIGAGRSDGAPTMPERPLGKTGYKVRIFSLGGQAALETAGMHDESIAIINRAIDLGVNYIDTAAAYGRDRNVMPRWESIGNKQKEGGEGKKEGGKEIFPRKKNEGPKGGRPAKPLGERLKMVNTGQPRLLEVEKGEGGGGAEQNLGERGRDRGGRESARRK